MGEKRGFWRAGHWDSEERALVEISDSSTISMILNNYDDIFSDFDPRAYLERGLSHDFLFEAKNAARDKAGSIKLSFLVPHHLRNKNSETVIAKRLREHFVKHHSLLHHEISDIQRRGAWFAFVGIIFGAFATYFSVSELNQIFKSALLILFEPASWFFIWSGLEHFFFVPQARKSELEFYSKMSRATIHFQGY